MEGPRTVPFVVRRAMEQDLDQVIEVNLGSLPENYWYGFYRYVLSEWGDLFLVAEADGRIVGYVMNRVEETHDRVLMGLENELEFPRRPSPLEALRRAFSGSAKVGHVISIAVLQEYRGRGIGSALMSEALRIFKEKYDVDAVYLEVRVSNTPAISMYERFGFVKARIVRSYYRDGEDAYVMVKRVKPAPAE
ncbi:MAG: GNAT family N-acetyltransferase [Acidilobus sp.]